MNVDPWNIFPFTCAFFNFFHHYLVLTSVFIMKPKIIEQLWYHDFFYPKNQQPDASHQKIRKRKKEAGVLVMEYVTPFHCSCIYNLSVVITVKKQATFRFVMLTGKLV